MANLTIPSNPGSFPEVYQLERTDLWDAGTGGNGLANTQAKQLAERDQWLRNLIERQMLADRIDFIETTAETINLTQATHAGRWVFVQAEAGIGGTWVVNLPLLSAVTPGAVFKIKNAATFPGGSANVTINRAGSNVISRGTTRNATSIVLSEGKAVMLKAGSEVWHVIEHM